MADVYQRYEQEKHRRRMVDFDDLLRLCRRDLREDREFAKAQHWRYQHLFVDEFQDVNPLQRSLLDAWVGGRRRPVRGGRPEPGHLRLERRRPRRAGRASPTTTPGPRPSG